MMDNEPSPKMNKSRREFLKSTVAVGGVAGVASVVGLNVMASEETDIGPETKTTKGYEETQHVLDYYKTTRY